MLFSVNFSKFKYNKYSISIKSPLIVSPRRHERETLLNKSAWEDEDALT